MVVPKKNEKWCVRIDYSNLNDACPIDTFPLPRIDQIVDVIASHRLLSFLDTYSVYNQILVFSHDLKNIAFITPMEMYCYNLMPFGLKNARANA